MAQGETKNLGQIAAIWVSAFAPENRKLVWYDTAERIHKVYNTANNTWEALNPQIVTNSNLSALKSIALGSGLSIGKYYYLTDVGTLAIPITTTKVWYVDSRNNYVVNDLAATIQSYINSNNLLIDGTRGVWDSTTGQLLFDFQILESPHVSIDNDYVVMRKKTNDTWYWVKSKLSNFISTLSGNSIKWRNGLFFNFTQSISEIKNKAGGIVGYDEYQNNNRDIGNIIGGVATSVQNLDVSSRNYTNSKTTASEIYSKQHSGAWSLFTNPPSVPNQSSTLEQILQILVSWVNVLQKADRITLGSGFSSNGRSGSVNYSDTVRSAIEKLINAIKTQSIANGINLPSSFNVNGRNGNLSSSDSLNVLLEKLIYKINDTVCNISEYMDSQKLLPYGKIYTFNNIPLEYRLFIQDNGELPQTYIVFALYRGTIAEGSSYPHPQRLFVFRQTSVSSAVYMNDYFWSNCPDEYKNLYCRSNAENVFLPSEFNVNGRSGDYSVNDTLDVMLEKLIKHISDTTSSNNIKLPQGWSAGTYSGEVADLDTISVAIGKLVKIINNIGSSSQSGTTLPVDFNPRGYSGIPAGGDSLISAIGKLSTQVYGGITEQISYTAYYMSGAEDSRAEQSTILKIRGVAAGVNILHELNTGFSTYEATTDKLLSNSTNDDCVIIVRDLPASVTRRIGAAHGYNNPISLSIPVTGCAGVDWKAVVHGTLYAILVQPPQDSDADAYLKLIPFFTHGSYLGQSVGFEYDGEGTSVSPTGWENDVTDLMVNKYGSFGSYALYNNSASGSIWRNERFSVLIPRFSVVIPC